MFSIKWVVRRHETEPVEIENSVFQSLDKVVESLPSAVSRDETQALRHTPTVFSCSIPQETKCDAGLKSARPKL